MQRIALLVSAFALVICSTGTAQEIFRDDFVSSGPSGDWGPGTYAAGAFGANGTISTVTGDVNWLSTTIDVPPGNTDGYFGRISHAATGYATSWRIAGSTAEASYTIEAKMYTEIVDTPLEPDDYHYCELVFYESVDGYGRYHTHLNNDTSILPSGPRIRVQTTHGGWTTPLQIFSPADFTASEGWHTFKIEISGQTATCYYDGGVVGTPDFSSVTGADHGSFGFGQYVDGDTGGNARSVYIDDFVVTQTSGDVEEWQLYE